MARVYAVASAKGGVGKTTTTANLSATLAAAGYDVAVIDGDIGMANLGNQLGVTATGPTLHDVLAGKADVEDATYDGPHGISVVPGDTDLTAFSDADITKLGRVIGSFADRDFVFIDTGAGLSHENALPLGLADEVVLVSTADRDALGDTEKTRELAERLGAEVAGVVLTRVTPGTAPEDATPLQAPILGSVPEDASLAEANNAGVPITIHDPDSPAATAYRSIGNELAEGPVTPPEAGEGETGAEGARGRRGRSASVSVPEEEPVSEAEAAAREFRESIRQGTDVEAEPEEETAEPEAEEPETEAAEPETQPAEPVESEESAEPEAPAESSEPEPEPEPVEPVEAVEEETEPAEPEEAGAQEAEVPAGAPGAEEVAIPEAEEGDEDEDEDAVPFARGERTAPLVEEQPSEGETKEESDEKEKKGFLSRLFG